MSGPRLQMRGITKRFGATLALDRVNLEVAGGEVLALVGENGAGKSTLMKILAGALPADAGDMWLDGQPYRPRDPARARAAGVAMIYQELSLAPHLSVADNILLGREPTRAGWLRRGEIRHRAAEALALLGHADLDPDMRVERLPMAERQLVEIARAVAVGCRLLVLDEPTSSLGAADIERLFALVRRLRDQGQAIIYISHFLEEVQALADRFTVLRDGVNVGGGPVSGCNAADIVAMMVGRPVTDWYPRSPRTPGAPLLELTGLAGAGKPLSATLTLHRGEVLGIAGLVGAGRTELLRTIFGLAPVRGGRIRVQAHIGPAAWAQGVGLVSEDRTREGLAVRLSLADNLTLPRLPAWVRPRAVEAAARRWTERLRIKCRSVSEPVARLSGGNQQKVALARLLEAQVDVLLLDEPTRGIDVGSKAEIYRLIDELATQGKGVLLVSSYLPELLGVCDRLAVMCRGRLGPTRPRAEWDEHRILTEATGG